MMYPVSNKNVLPMVLAAFLVPVALRLGQHFGSKAVLALQEREEDEDEEDEDDDGDETIAIIKENFGDFCKEVVAPSVCNNHLDELINVFTKEKEKRSAKEKTRPEDSSNTSSDEKTPEAPRCSSVTGRAVACWHSSAL